jgi:hypothetical protein
MWHTQNGVSHVVTTRHTTGEERAGSKGEPWTRERSVP